MKRIFLTVSVSLVIMVLLFGCSSSETHQHIEVYVTEVLEKNNEGIFESTGYKKVK